MKGWMNLFYCEIQRSIRDFAACAERKGLFKKMRKYQKAVRDNPPEKPSLFMRFQLKFKLLVLVAGIFLQTHEVSPAEFKKLYTPVAQADAIWNLEHFVDSNDAQVIVLLEKINNMPEPLWHKILSISLDDQRQLLRDYLIARFTFEFPYFGQNEEIFSDFIRLLTEESRRLMIKDMPDDADVKRMTNLLKCISQWKIKELFYQTSSLIAYPLLEVRKVANETISIIKDDRIFPIVLKLSVSTNPVERTYAIDTLYYLKDDRTFPILLQLLNDKNKSVRYYAVRSLEVLNLQEAIPYYVRILYSDVNDEVRILTSQVLAKLKPAAAFNTLLEVLSDKNPKVRKSALLAINEYNNPAAAFYISKQLAQETDRELKVMQINSLLSLNNSGLMTGLNRVIKDETDINVLLWAIYAAGKLGDYNGYEFVLEKISHKSERVREEAAMALGSFKVKKSIPLLIKTLQDYNETFGVQTAAIYSLEMIDDNTAINDLYNLSMAHHNPLVRAGIKGILKNMLEKRFK